jgi:hypothetical protein
VLGIAVVAFWSTMFMQAARAADSLAEPWSPVDAADDPSYRKAIKEGLAEYDALHFEEARSLFRRAHEISPSARTFRGMGMASFELRDYVSAVRNLSAALRDQRKPLSAEQRRRAQDLLDRSRAFVDVCALKVSPRNARVIVDGHAPEFEPDGTLLFGFGLHTVEVSAQAMEIRSLTLNVHGGERRELSVKLAPMAAGPADATVSRPWYTGGPHGFAAAWLWSSASAALLAGGSGIYWYMQNSQLNSCHNPANGYRCTNESAVKTQRNIALGLTVGFGAAALTTAIIGTILWNSGPAPAIGPSTVGCTVQPFGVAYARSF